MRAFFKTIRAFITQQIQTHSVRQVLIFGVVIALLLRCALLYEESKDYVRHLEPWYDFIAQNGGLAALKSNFSNYTPAYQYWLVIASSWLAALPKVISIKLPSIVFDFVCAFFVYKLVQLKYPQGKQPITAFLVVLFTPTVFLNSAFWGQCDSIYTSGLVACVYFLCIHKEIWAFLSFGIAFAFKQQAVFLTPFLLILALKKKVSWISFLWVPIVYGLSIIPAWMAGRPLKDLLLVYFSQANQYRHLAANAPSIFSLFPFHDPLYYFWFGLGFVLTLSAIAFITFRVLKSKVPLTHRRIVALAFLMVLVVPYFLPKMHDRYFYPADVLAIPFGFYFPRYYWVTMTVEFVSFHCYLPRLWNFGLLPFFVLALIMGRVVWFMLRQCQRLFPRPMMLSCERKPVILS
jgi:Gpi18-like mannosyltransferase